MEQFGKYDRFTPDKAGLPLARLARLILTSLPIRNIFFIAGSFLDGFSVSAQLRIYCHFRSHLLNFN